MITKADAVTLALREIHYHDSNLTIAGMSQVAITKARQTCNKWRRNGATKTWKTRPNEFRVPIKHGLYDFAYLTHENADKFFHPDECTNKENH